MAEEKKEAQKQEPKKVVFDHKALSSANKNKWDIRTKDVPVPELNRMMGVDEEKGEMVIMVVRQMEFSELIESQQGQFDYLRNLVEGIMEAASNKEAVKREVQDAMDNKSVLGSQRIDVIEKCLVEPKLNRSEIVYIAKMFPSVALRLHNVIMDLTNRGADLKKNSSG